VDATLTETQLLSDGVRYKYGKYLANDVVVKFHPRTVGTALDTLGTLQQSVTVRQGGTTTINLAFDDGSGNRIGGYGVVCEANTDYTASAHSNGNPPDLTASVSAEVVEGGNSCRITFTNSATQDAYIDVGSRVRGYKITDFGEQEYHLLDTASIGDYGRQRLIRNLRMLDDLEYARNLALWEVDIHGAPEGQIEGVTIAANVSDALMTQALARTIGDRISVSESQTGISGKEYFIKGEKHTLPTRSYHRTEWVLMPSRALLYWVLGTVGYSELGETTWLAL
jgi:hypothetical protein